MASKTILAFLVCIVCTFANPMYDGEIIENLKAGEISTFLEDNFNVDFAELEELGVDVQGLKKIINNIDIPTVQRFLENLIEGEEFEGLKEFLETVPLKDPHPELGLNTVELIERHGYTSETYAVTTDDGYILTLHRIPHGKENAGEEGKPPVLVMAGILCSSADWVLNGPGKALAYLLAEAGYDVWLGNNRGTTESRNHTSLPAGKGKKYWNFSFNEMGTKDLPALIDFILAKTNQEKLFYIGHSQGTTSFFVMGAELPKYNNKIRLMSALAPVSYSGRVKNILIKLVLPFQDLFAFICSLLNINQIPPHSQLMTNAGQFFCSDGAPTQGICTLIMFAIVGFDEPQMNKTNLPLIFSNFPAGGSVKQFWHFSQLMKSGKFRKYDYGLLGNLQRYGRRTPPAYKVSKITAPVAAFYSENDMVSSDKDVAQLLSELPNVALDHLMPYKQFNHMDFMWAIDGDTLVYNIMIDLMKKY